MYKTKMTVTSLLFTGILFFSQTSLSQQNKGLSDAEIASVAVTANQIDIDYAQIALQRSKNDEVLNFARTMTSDHQAVIDQAVALVTKLHVTPQINHLTKKLLSDAEKTKQQLRARKGKAFDKAYVDNEVSYHKAVISVVETVLIPDTENSEVRSLLQAVVPALKTHLAHAEMIQKQISQ